jgi:hypothetical protein
MTKKIASTNTATHHCGIPFSLAAFLVCFAVCGRLGGCGAQLRRVHALVILAWGDTSHRTCGDLFSWWGGITSVVKPKLERSIEMAQATLLRQNLSKSLLP